MYKRQLLRLVSLDAGSGDAKVLERVFARLDFCKKVAGDWEGVEGCRARVTVKFGVVLLPEGAPAAHGFRLPNGKFNVIFCPQALPRQLEHSVAALKALYGLFFQLYLVCMQTAGGQEFLRSVAAR